MSFKCKPSQKPNKQFWRYASFLAFIATFLLVPSTTSWASALHRACFMAYVMTYLDTSYRDGSRAWPWFQRLPVWRLYCRYIKGQVITTVPLDPHRQYIFAAHPHGIATWNHFLTMTDGCRFLSRIYPRPRLDLGATVLFFIPLVKEVLLWVGCVDAGAATANAILERGFSSLIYVGGEKEQILTERGRDLVVVLPRKGFCKLALRYDCPIVPAYAFGENDLYRTFNYFKGLQLWVARALKLACPPCWGFPLLPFLPLPAPVTVVMGAPLSPRREGRAGGDVGGSRGGEPTREEVEDLHARYVEALTALFETHKVRYGGRSPGARLEVR
ncbi:diacylglycerol acyltransferase 2 [Nannochloropsis gaditana CCMP526]|uniref:diacylglycerol acyltransferase 2 n=1 Tax=Nannochloropsis gaditana (strain CCMP526) TaxID=1093141 RepID=UPI00029F71E4|nr:diacylglycerol acyltransferase 2 [Nannochloropsis gaditana CCMP526]EKU21865.1 diacylglycerol acyltransferase 2 [Nannochloropsis gaditana CCMP526]|eukprot:XP_005854493.1 diacylglycerol acyltransferase 2 [Nannochloropsis gaditana CCMP526]